MQVQDIWGLLAGGVAGIVVERTLNLSGRLLEPAWYRTGGRLIRRRRRNLDYRLRLKSWSVLTAGRGEHDLFVLEFAPRGFRPEHLYIESASASDLGHDWPRVPDNMLPMAFTALDAAIKEERRNIESSPGMWNARRLVLRSVRTTRVGDEERPGLHLAFGESDFATHRVVSRAWESLYRSGAVQLSEATLSSVVPGLSHSFGVNLTIETADDSVVLTRRSELASQAKGLRHVAVNEGMALVDQDRRNCPDPYETALRGLREEMGVDLSAYRDKIVFHSLILDATRYEWALLGHVDLRSTEFTETAIRMQRGVGASSDAWESDDLTFSSWDVESVLSLIESDEEWVGHGYLNLVLSAMYRFPSSQDRIVGHVRQALGKTQPDRRGKLASR